ncbi:hypothetical protein V6Z11_A13G154400 [Gossypium hirsutum]
MRIQNQQMNRENFEKSNLFYRILNYLLHFKEIKCGKIKSESVNVKNELSVEDVQELLSQGSNNPYSHNNTASPLPLCWASILASPELKIVRTNSSFGSNPKPYCRHL